MTTNDESYEEFRNAREAHGNWAANYCGIIDADGDYPDTFIIYGETRREITSVEQANDAILAAGAVDVCGDEPQTGHEPTEAALASMNLVVGERPGHKPLPAYLIPMPPDWLVNMRADLKDLQLQMDEMEADYQVLMARIDKAIKECEK